jgi:O-antigen/teichoic acid export membrane protein
MTSTDSIEAPTSRSTTLTGHLRLVAGFGAAKAIPGLIVLISVPVWLHLYGLRNYGLFSLYWATALIGTSLTTGWLRQAVLRHTGVPGMGYERLPRRHRRMVEFSAAVTTVPLAAVTWTALSDHGERLTFLGFAAAALVTNSWYLLRQTLAQRDGRAGPYALAETVRAGVALLVSVVLALSGRADSWTLIGAHAMAAVVAGLLLTSPPDPAPLVADPPRSRLLADYWRFGWPLSLWLALSATAMYIDRYVLTLLYGADRAGAYAAAADLVVRGMGIAVVPVLLVLHPRFMRAWNTDDRARTIRAWKRMMWALTGAVTAACGIAIAAYVLWSEALLVAPVPVLAFTALAFGAGGWQIALLAHKPLEAGNRTGWMLGALLASFATTVALHLALAPAWAEVGVAVSFAAGPLVYIGLITVLTRHVNARGTAL